MSEASQADHASGGESGQAQDQTGLKGAMGSWGYDQWFNVGRGIEKAKGRD